ncbi:arsenite efflux MFS transporter ArsK [Devosia sp.]|uniref:arsenite efflux MFS transporter ArsK n=1 Tax=Devosia sp. TaxID=1871048 RepID=UPI003A951986
MARAIPVLVIWGLGLTQIIGFGTLYYAFGVLAPAIAADFGWAEPWLFGLFSAAVLAGGLVAPLIGGWADRFGAARVMSIGALLVALSLAGCAIAPEPLAYGAGLLSAELASGAVLYAIAFTALTQWSGGTGAPRAITLLTLIGGFASTLFWPFTAWLLDAFGWRGVHLVFAGLHLAICLPIHLLVARHAPARGATTETAAASDIISPTNDIEPIVAQRLLLLGFGLIGFTLAAVLVHMVPTLTALGLGSSALVVSSLFGPAQVLARLANMQFGRRLSQLWLAVIAAGCLPLAILVLIGSSPSLAGALVFALLFGVGSGLSSIVSGTLPLVLFGREGYGRRVGAIGAARAIASAFAPVLFAVGVSLFSAALALGLTAAAALGALACFCRIAWLDTRPVAFPRRPRAAKTAASHDQRRVS